MELNSLKYLYTTANAGVIILCTFLLWPGCIFPTEHAKQKKLETRRDSSDTLYLFAEAVVYSHKETGKKLALVDMVHVGDENFYRSVEDFFAEMSQEVRPSVLLTEGIRCESEGTENATVLQVIEEKNFDPDPVQLQNQGEKEAVRIDYKMLINRGFADYKPCSDLPSVNRLHEQLAQSLGLTSQTTYKFPGVKSLVDTNRMVVRSGDINLADSANRDEALLYSLFVAQMSRPPLYCIGSAAIGI